MVDRYEQLESAIREWQDAREALDQAVQDWVSAPIEDENPIKDEKKLVDRVLAAEKRLMEL